MCLKKERAIWIMWMENGYEKGCKTDGFAALDVWLPSADSNHGPDG